MEIRILGVEGVIPVLHDAAFRRQERQPPFHHVDQGAFKPVSGIVRFKGFGKVLVIGFRLHPFEQPVDFAGLIGVQQFQSFLSLRRITVVTFRKHLEHTVRIIVFEKSADAVCPHQFMEKGNGDPS